MTGVASRWLPTVALCCLSLLVGYCGATEVADRKAERWLAERDALTDSLLVERLENARLLSIATQPDTVRLPARRDTVRVAADSAGLAATVDTLLREQAQLHQRIGRDSVKLAAYARLVVRQDSQITRLTNLVNRAPVKTPRGINLFGLRLCPTVGVGAALTADGRVGPALAVVQPLSCGD